MPGLRHPWSRCKAWSCKFATIGSDVFGVSAFLNKTTGEAQLSFYVLEHSGEQVLMVCWHHSVSHGAVDTASLSGRDGVIDLVQIREADDCQSCISQAGVGYHGSTSFRLGSVGPLSRAPLGMGFVKIQNRSRGRDGHNRGLRVPSLRDHTGLPCGRWCPCHDHTRRASKRPLNACKVGLGVVGLCRGRCRLRRGVAMGQVLPCISLSR